MKLKSTECNVCFKDYIEKLRCIIYIAVEIDLLEIFIRICTALLVQLQQLLLFTTPLLHITNIYNTRIVVVVVVVVVATKRITKTGRENVSNNNSFVKRFYLVSVTNVQNYPHFRNNNR